MTQPSTHTPARWIAAAAALVLALAAWVAFPAPAAAEGPVEPPTAVEADRWLELEPVEEVSAADADREGVDSTLGEASADAPDAVSLDLTIDRGCGASYPIGAPIRIEVRVSHAGYYKLTSTTAAGTKTVADQYLYANVTYRANGWVGLPNGTHTLRLSGNGTSASCAFQAGTSPPPAAGSISLDKLWTMNDYLQPTTCIPSGRRVYFGARVRNSTSAPATVSVALLTRGRISTYTMEHIEMITLQPGQVRDVHGYADGLADRTYDYKVLLIVKAKEVDSGKTSFRVGGC